MRTNPQHLHLCVFARSEEHQAEAAARFVADGIDHAERVVFLDPDGDTTWLTRRLGEDDLDPVAMVESGWLLPATGSITDVPYTIPGSVTRVLNLAPVPWDCLVGDPPVHTLCVYEARGMSDVLRTTVLAGHAGHVDLPALYDDGALRVTRHPGEPLRLAGELDIVNRPGFAEVLHAVMAEASGPLRLDVGSLRFADAGGVDAMRAAAAASGRHVLLLRARPVLRRIVTLLDPTAELLSCGDEKRAERH